MPRPRKIPVPYVPAHREVHAKWVIIYENAKSLRKTLREIADGFGVILFFPKNWPLTDPQIGNTPVEPQRNFSVY